MRGARGRILRIPLVGITAVDDDVSGVGVNGVGVSGGIRLGFASPGTATLYNAVTTRRPVKHPRIMMGWLKTKLFTMSVVGTQHARSRRL